LVGDEMIQNNTKMITIKPPSFLTFTVNHHPNEQGPAGPRSTPVVPHRDLTCEPDRRAYANGVYKENRTL
jgi:hypothetical protein